MTEAEWLACDDPRLMLEFVEARVKHKKIRCFADESGIDLSLYRDFWLGERHSNEALVQAGLLREIIGNPFRSPTFAPAWRSAAVIGIARAIYADRAFDRMPILADALQDAGCDHADVLEHCRGPGPHVRGCWVVDLLRGKE